MFRHCLAATLMLCLGGSVQATVSAEVRIGIPPGAVSPPVQTGITSASSAIAMYGGTASASIDARSGVALGSVLAPTEGRSTAVMDLNSGLITFGAGASGVGSLVYRFYGDISSAIPGNQLSLHGDGAQLSLSLKAPAYQFRYMEFTNKAVDSTVPQGCNTTIRPVCLVGTAFDYTGTLHFDIAPGTVTSNQLFNVFAFNGRASTFGFEQHFELPPGVSYVSTLPVVVVVPEPSTLGLLLAGLFVIGRFRDLTMANLSRGRLSAE